MRNELPAGREFRRRVNQVIEAKIIIREWLLRSRREGEDRELNRGWDLDAARRRHASFGFRQMANTMNRRIRPASAII